MVSLLRIELMRSSSNNKPAKIVFSSKPGVAKWVPYYGLPYQYFSLESSQRSLLNPDLQCEKCDSDSQGLTPSTIYSSLEPIDHLLTV